MIDVRIDSGIEIKTIKVDRQDPRNSRIISPVRPAAIAPSWRTPAIDAVTSFDWSNSSLMPRPGGAAARAASRTFRTPLTTATVEALPFLRTLSSALDFRAERQDQADVAGGPSNRQRSRSGGSRGGRRSRNRIHRRVLGRAVPAHRPTGPGSGGRLTLGGNALPVLSRTSADSRRAAGLH